MEPGPTPTQRKSITGSKSATGSSLGLQECTSCWEKKRNHVKLPCHHMVCIKCLGKMVAVTSDIEFECPKCNEMHPIVAYKEYRRTSYSTGTGVPRAR